MLGWILNLLLTTLKRFWKVSFSVKVCNCWTLTNVIWKVMHKATFKHQLVHAEEILESWSSLSADAIKRSLSYTPVPQSLRGSGGSGPPQKIFWDLENFFPEGLCIIVYRFNTKTFCKENVKEACLSHSRGWKIEHFPSAQTMVGLLSYNTILKLE